MSYQTVYNQKLDLVKKSLIEHCKTCISDNWDQMFDMWLTYEADIECGYIDEFKEEFSQYINKDIEERLFIAGKNIKMAIWTFMQMYDDDVELDVILKFTEKFIENQIIDFDNWCGEISMKMYEESSDYERDELESNQKN